MPGLSHFSEAVAFRMTGRVLVLRRIANALTDAGLVPISRHAMTDSLLGMIWAASLRDSGNLGASRPHVETRG